MGKKELRYGTDYPDQCPPKSCKRPDNITVFRACNVNICDENGNLNLKNFIPVCEQKDRRFKDESQICKSKAISFYFDLERLKKLAKHFGLGNQIIQVTLNKNCGYMEKKGSHCSLWDFKSPNISEAIGKNWKLVYESKKVNLNE